MRVNIGEHNLDKSYQFYLTETRKNGDLVVKDPLSCKEYKAICHHYLKLMAQALLDGKVVNLGAYLGELQVSKKPINLDNLPFDYGYFHKTGEKVKLLNEHTDGFRMRFLWRKKKCLVKGKRPYCFQPSRGLSRALAQTLKATPNSHTQYSQVH